MHIDTRVKLLHSRIFFFFSSFFEEDDISDREDTLLRKKKEEEENEIVSGGIKFTRSRLSVRLNTKKMYSARQHFSSPSHRAVNPVCRHTMDPMNSTAFQFRS